MVIRKEDRVATVLRHDESLVDVFVALSPAFERLRSTGMRKVMSRLVTVEQAARMAGVDAEELVRRLNASGQNGRTHPMPTRNPEAAPAKPATVNGAPAALRRIPRERIVEIDVRDELRAGREPFSMIMVARRNVPEGGAFGVRAIFEPVPLYAVMGRQGFAHYTEQFAADDWRVWFYPAPVESPAAEPAVVRDIDAGAGNELEGVTILDVRGLEPPDPMVRTLTALESLPPGGTLLQINVRVPRFLLPQLEERGFTYEVREQAPDLVRVFIRRAPDEPVGNHKEH
ncbi:MAG: DUF2249 domain-containing protein [Longimicrobiales bacterium]